jgi:hypothetical protein
LRYWLIVCLTLWQALISVGGANAHAFGWAHDRGAASIADHCGDVRRGDETPSKDSPAAHCCILCVAGGCGGFDLATAPAPTTLARSPCAAASTRLVALPHLQRKPLGWGCSWSSRAPPVLS